MRKVRYAFTMIELIFVIVIIGILSKFGVEFLAQAYNSFIFSKINNTLQANSATAVEGIASRLQFRIKDSIIAKDPNANSFQALAGSTLDRNATVLEWVGYDVDGLRGNNNATWSGVIDLYGDSNATQLSSPGTDTGLAKILIENLSNSTFNDSAIYFIGSDSDIQTGYGWDSNLTNINLQQGAMHPVSEVAGDATKLAPIAGTIFSGTDIYEYYQLAWTAYAVSLEDFDGDGNLNELVLYYDYQPWLGELYDDVTSSRTLLMENVDTFRFKAIGSVVKIQVCVFTDLIKGEEYSLCKEKTIF